MFMKKLTTAFAVSAMLAGGVLGAQTAKAETYNLTVCGASPGGLWSLLGAGIDAAMKAEDSGNTVTYQTSGGGYANVALLEQNKCELAIIHDAEAQIASVGGGPFQAPQDHLTTVAVLYTWAPMQFIVSKDFAEEHGVSSLEDVVEKQAPIRILLNRRGNIASEIGEAMINAAGATLEDIESWGGSVTFAASSEQGDLIRDRRADAILNSLFVGHRSIRQVADAIDVVLLPISQDTAAAVAEEYKINTHVIPGGSYEWAAEDTQTVTLSAQLFARKDADPQLVSDVTTALIENVDKVSGVHKAMAPLDVPLMASSKTVPYHPAAVDAYKAAGAM